MSGQAKRQKRFVGDIVKIDLNDRFFAYARVLEEALFAFYDCHVKEDLPIDLVARCPILFQVPVMDHAIKRGRWQIIGNVPLDDVLRNPPPRFIQDPLHPEKFSIYDRGVSRPASRAECVGLEREAVWDPTHVEDRLRDHYAGRQNKWVESLKPKG